MTKEELEKENAILKKKLDKLEKFLREHIDVGNLLEKFLLAERDCAIRVDRSENKSSMWRLDDKLPALGDDPCHWKTKYIKKWAEKFRDFCK